MRLFLAILLGLILAACDYRDKPQNVIIDRPVIENFDYRHDSIVLYQPKKSTSSNKEYRGIDTYTCIYDTLSGLQVHMSWGLMNGASFELNIKDDTIFTRFYSWGCTSDEYYNYIATYQKIKLNSLDFHETDSVSGYIEYRAVQDVETKIQENVRYGLPTKWLRSIEPLRISIIGYFKLKIHDSPSSFSTEYSIRNIYVENRRAKYLCNVDSVKRNLTTVLNGSRMYLDTLPTDITELTNIEYLNLRGNWLKDINTDQLKGLDDLKLINLSINDISSFPISLLELKELRVIDLSSNPISHVPIQEILASHLEKLRLSAGSLSDTDVEKLGSKLELVR